MTIYGVYRSAPVDVSEREIVLLEDHLYLSLEDAEVCAYTKNEKELLENEHKLKTHKTDRCRIEFFIEAINVK